MAWYEFMSIAKYRELQWKRSAEGGSGRGTHG
jgi:hypothetical protein